MLAVRCDQNKSKQPLERSCSSEKFPVYTHWRCLELQQRQALLFYPRWCLENFNARRFHWGKRNYSCITGNIPWALWFLWAHLAVEASIVPVAFLEIHVGEGCGFGSFPLAIAGMCTRRWSRKGGDLGSCAEGSLGNNQPLWASAISCTCEGFGSQGSWSVCSPHYRRLRIWYKEYWQ